MGGKLQRPLYLLCLKSSHLGEQQQWQRGGCKIVTVVKLLLVMVRLLYKRWLIVGYLVVDIGVVLLEDEVREDEVGEVELVGEDEWVGEGEGKLMRLMFLVVGCYWC